jgi:hypothetical protein
VLAAPSQTPVYTPLERITVSVCDTDVEKAQRILPSAIWYCEQMCDLVPRYQRRRLNAYNRGRVIQAEASLRVLTRRPLGVGNDDALLESALYYCRGVIDLGRKEPRLLRSSYNRGRTEQARELLRLLTLLD